MSNLFLENFGEIFSSLMALFIVFFVFAIFVVEYIVASIANVKVLKYFNHSRPWAGWVPVYSLVCLTECMAEEDGKIDAFFGKVPKKYFVFWPVAVVVANMMIPYFGTILGTFVATALGVVTYKDLLSQQSGKEEIALGIVCALFPIAWIIVALIRFKGSIQ